MTKLFKNSKQIMAVVMAFAILAVSLFAGGIVAGAETTNSLCEGRIEYWNGDRDTTLSGQGTQQNPYIITNAAELNYVCTGANQATEDKYYVVDPTIKAFILQPQSIVDALGGPSTFIDITSAAETKELFEVTAAGKSLVSWVGRGEGVFAGHFDGNGVTIYGLYSDGTNVPATQQASALFPKVDGNGANVDKGAVTNKPTTLTRFSVKNSYFKGFRRVGVVAATSWWKSDSGTNCDGWIELSYCEVANNFLVGQNRLESDNSLQSFNHGEMGVVCGAPGQDPFKVSYISVHGNDTEYRSYASGTSTTYTVDSSKDFNRMFSSNGKNETDTMYGEVHKSIVLDTSVTGLLENAGEIIYVSDVYTNLSSTIKGVTVLENVGYGAAGQAAMEKLDWEEDWFMGLNGPALRAFHGEFELVRTSTEHYYACADCGSAYLLGEQMAHEWDNDTCTICEYHCYHNEEGFYVSGEYRPATCISKEATSSYCNNCDWNQTDEFGPAPSGHVLEWVEEIPAGCYANGVEAEGRKGFWHCTECGGMFIEETEAEAMWSANPIGSYLEGEEIPVVDSLIIPLGNHSAVNRADGSILIKDAGAEGHYWICYTCDGRLEAVESEEVAEEGALKKHKFEKSVCTDCGWECTEHDYKATGIVAVVGTCEVDQEEEIKCTICGDIKNVVTAVAGHKIVKVDEVPATDKLEGTKAHYKCSVCQEIYVDAEGKTKATTAELVIAKTLPAGYENVEIGNLNTDNSGKSPATGDNVASVLAVAALAGAVLVFARKK